MDKVAKKIAEDTVKFNLGDEEVRICALLALLLELIACKDLA